MLSTNAYAYLNIEHPVCAWATYRGVLVSAAPDDGREDLGGGISIMLASMLADRNFTRLNNELAIERVRQQRHPGRVSRLRGMYCFPDRKRAERARWGGHFAPEYLAELHLLPTSRQDRLDSNWITYAKLDRNGFLIDPSAAEFDGYWEGKAYPGRDPVWETIIDGRMIVLGTKLRDRAYEVVRRSHPQSLALLEVARIAAWVESDLGNIRAWIRDDGDRFSLHFLQDMRDANDPEFLERVRQLIKKGHSINRADLYEQMKDGSFGKTMDLRQYGFSAPKTELPFIRPSASPEEAETVSPEMLRVAGRLSALEHLVTLLVFDRARFEGNPSAWITQFISNIKRGTDFISQMPLAADVEAQLRVEAHKAILEFADALELHLREAISAGHIKDTGNNKSS